MIPGGTRFIGISESVNLTERKSSGLNAETEPYTMDDITSTVKPYKVYTALLTQSGGDSNDSVVGDQTINVGVTYTIDYLAPGDNLIPYGSPNNNQGTSFVCNQDVINWGSGTSQLSFNTGAPVATVLENTIGNIWFTYDGVGSYSINSNDLFTVNKTIILQDQQTNRNDNDTNYSIRIIYVNIDTTFIGTNNSSFVGINDALLNTPIEIRVYS